MPDVDPCPPSASPDESPLVLMPTFHGLFRDGRFLVVHRDATLPDICVKSNEPAQGRLRRRLHHPSIGLIVLCILTVTPIGICMAVLHRSAVIDIGLSEIWFAKRRRAIAIGWTVFLGGVAVFVGGFLCRCLGYGPPATGGMVAGLPIVLGGATLGCLASRMVAAQRVTEHHIWLKGVCSEFLAYLRPWPCPPGKY